MLLKAKITNKELIQKNLTKHEYWKTSSFVLSEKSVQELRKHFKVEVIPNKRGKKLLNPIYIFKKL